MKRPILLFGLLCSLTSVLFAQELTDQYQKDLVSNQWLQQENIDKRVNPGALTELMSGLTAFYLLNKFDDKSKKEILKNKENIIFNLSYDKYKYIIKFLKIDDNLFISEMNRIAKKINLKNTHFISAFSTSNSLQYTTPEDLMILVKFLYENFSNIQYYSESIKSAISNSQDARRVFNSNKLCTPIVFGGKFENHWNAVFISKNNYNNRTRELVSIILNAPNIEFLADQARQTIIKGFTQYETLKIFNRGDIVGAITVRNGIVQQLPVNVSEDIFLSLKKSELKNSQQPFTIHISHPSPLKAPIVKGEKVGTLTIKNNHGDSINTPIYATENIAKGNFWQRFTDTIKISLE